MTATEFELTADDRGRLTLKRPGEDDVTDVRVRRAFPLSKADRFVSIRTSEGKEVLLIDDLAALDASRRQVIERALDANSFIPQIRSVTDVNVNFGYQEWSVRTDRGPATFRVQEREDIRFLPDGRFRIKDADGNVYEMPELASLNDASRKAVEPLL